MLWFWSKSSPPCHQLPIFSNHLSKIHFDRSGTRNKESAAPVFSAQKDEREREKYQKDCLVMPGLIEARCSKAETAVFYLFYSSVSKSLSLAPSKLYFGLFINIHVRSFFWRVFNPGRMFLSTTQTLPKTGCWSDFRLGYFPPLFPLRSLARGHRWRSRRMNKCFFRIFFRLLACLSLQVASRHAPTS